MIEKSPRAQTRETLRNLRDQTTDVDTGLESKHVKAEVYAIVAYFIEKTTERAMIWLQEHPNRGLLHHVNSVEPSQTRSSVIFVKNLNAYLAESDVETILQKISLLIEGLLHQHIKEVMNADFPAPLVNVEDEPIQERLRSLLEKDFRGGGSFAARDFVLGATRAPAVFVPTALYAGLSAYQKEFGSLPDVNELDVFAKKNINNSIKTCPS